MLRLWASVMRRSKSASVPSLGLTWYVLSHHSRDRTWQDGWGRARGCHSEAVDVIQLVNESVEVAVFVTVFVCKGVN